MLFTRSRFILQACLLALGLMSAQAHAASPLIELTSDRIVAEGGIRAHQGVDVLLRLSSTGWQMGSKTLVARFDLEGGFQKIEGSQVLRSARLKFVPVQQMTQYLMIQDQEDLGTQTELMKQTEFMPIQIESNFSIGLREMYQVDIIGVRVSSAHLSSAAVMTFANLAIQGLGAKILRYVSSDQHFDGFDMTKLEMDLGLALWMNRPVSLVFGIGGSIGTSLGLNRLAQFGVEADGDTHASMKVAMNGWTVGILGTLRFVGDTANKVWANAFDYALTAEFLF